MIEPNFHHHSRSHTQRIRPSNHWKSRTLKGALWLVSTAAMLAPGLSVKAEMIMGVIESYDPQTRQATVSLGKQDGVGKYDRGKIELKSLDSPEVKFIGANIVVVSVDENSAVVSVREAPGIQVPIQAGAEVTLDTDSGIARREEEAKIIAAKQAEQARQEQQLEAARRQRELELERAEQARQQQLEAQRAEQARQQQLEAQRAEQARQQQLEAQRAEQARQQQLEAQQTRQQKLEAARRQQQLEAQQARQQQPENVISPEANSEAEQKSADLDEARELWQSELDSDSETTASDLPLDYLQAYTNAREQPSPETHYRFAQILINYEIYDQAITWLDETQSRFPATKPANNFYRAVALIQQGNIAGGQKILETADLPDDRLTDEFKSYLYTKSDRWDDLFALAEHDSAVIYNNRLIAQYCSEPFGFERDTDLSPGACPSGSLPPEIQEDGDEDDEDRDEEDELANSDRFDEDKDEEDELADSDRFDEDQDEEDELADSDRSEEQNVKTLKQIGDEAINTYPDDPYILNTLGFIALQSEDYQLAYEYYEQLAQMLDQYDSTPPRLQSLKANAISYINNYNQNYEFLADNGEDLDSLRSRQNSVTDAIIIGGVGSAVASALTNDVSPVGLVGGILATFLRFNQSKSRAKRIDRERNSIFDQMHQTFTKDIDLVATPPDLAPDSLLNLSSDNDQVDVTSDDKIDVNSDDIDQKLRQFDDFWEKN